MRMLAAVLPMTPELEHPLTPREIDVLWFVADGCTNAEVGAQLGISRHTVQTHLERIFTKTRVRTRGGVVAWAFRAGILS